MKSTLIQVPQKESYSFRVTLESAPYFYNPYHHHDELELTYVLKSRGQRFVGDSVERFEPGDLVLVGANLPHCWKNDKEYLKPDSKLKAEAIVIQFREDFAGPTFFHIPELKKLAELIEDARMGIVFNDHQKRSLLKEMNRLLNTNDEDRIIRLLSILNDLAHTENKRYLCKTYTGSNLKNKNLERLNRIFRYTLDNINENITLEEVSAAVHLSPQAFCRYFKLHTRKTYKEFLNEIRISNVCRQLRETELSVSEIAYANGFSSLSHFTRTFKQFTSLRPLDYRREMVSGHHHS